jgi:hypothetical protein
MRDNLRPTAVVAIVLGAIVGCHDSGGGAGTERAACYPNGTCNAGLACLSDVCVRAPDGGTPADAGIGSSDTAGESDGGSTDARGEDAAPVDQVRCLPSRTGGMYCIDVYEASRVDATRTSAGVMTSSAPRSIAGVLPWAEITWADAQAACVRRAMRLCERDEWIDACHGAVGEDAGTTYTYGDTRDPTRCNVQGTGPAPTGSFAGCESGDTTFDQAGNLWEWTGSVSSAAAARGGGWGSSITHRCADEAMGSFAIDQPSPEVGFRCCR